MNRAHGLILTAALSLTAFGCGRVVSTAGADATDDLRGDNGLGGSGTSSTSTGTSNPPPIQGNDIAVTNGDKLEVKLANYLQTCGVDTPQGCGPTAVWQVSFDLPLAQLSAGSVVSLKDAGGFETGSDAQDPASPNVCGGGGGTYWDGTVEVLSVSASQVSLRLTGTMPVLFGAGTADGDYVVELCGQKPPPGHALTSAVATPSSVNAQNLTLHATNLPNTCSDPDNSLQGCSVEHAGVSIELSPAMQAVGVYPLDSIATFSDWEPGTGGECGGGGGSYWGGTIEIVSIDAANVVFTLSGTDPFFTANANADGTYTAPRCN